MKIDWDTSAPVTRITDEPVSYDTLDEAIAAAMDELEPGGRLDIHGEDCESEDGEDGCTCTPMSIVKGAAA